MAGAICGGVVSQSKLNKNPMGHLMAFVMLDELKMSIFLTLI